MAKSPWQQAFFKRFANPRFDGTGWEYVYATLIHASAKAAKGAEPFWVGIELTYPEIDHGYTGVLCIDGTGKVLCTNKIQRHTRALESIRNQWPRGGQFRFLKDRDDLQRAARRSLVFGAVVDAASPAAMSLAESFAKEIAIGNAQTQLCVLTVIALPASRSGVRPAGSLPLTPVAFDVLLRSETTEPWLEHRDLAVIGGTQRVGLIGVDFNDVRSIFREYERSNGRRVSKRRALVGATASGSARGPGRASIAARRALRGIAKSLALSQVTDVIVNIGSDPRLAKLIEYKTIPELVREACHNIDELVLVDDYRDQGACLSVDIIAVTGGSVGKVHETD